MTDKSMSSLTRMLGVLDLFTDVFPDLVVPVADFFKP